MSKPGFSSPQAIFKNLIIAAAGPLPGKLTVERLKDWTCRRKGIFTEGFDETVTHLLCTEEQFRKRVPRIQLALRTRRKPHIVLYDWYEISAAGKEKREPELKYCLRLALKEEQDIRRHRRRIAQGEKLAERFINPNFYHVYHDRLFFAHNIEITRDNFQDSGNVEKYTLSLWESNAKPHLYCFTAKYSRRKGDSQPHYVRGSRLPGRFSDTIALFMDFFQIKTGIHWYDRVIEQKTTPLSNFQYTPPTRGKPVGRRLRFSHFYGLQLNAALRGLPLMPDVENLDDAGARNALGIVSPQSVEDESENEASDSEAENEPVGGELSGTVEEGTLVSSEEGQHNEEV